jgi:hypothetical protein
MFAPQSCNQRDTMLSVVIPFDPTSPYSKLYVPSFPRASALALENLNWRTRTRTSQDSDKKIMHCQGRQAASVNLNNIVHVITNSDALEPSSPSTQDFVS